MAATLTDDPLFVAIANYNEKKQEFHNATMAFRVAKTELKKQVVDAGIKIEHLMEE